MKTLKITSLDSLDTTVAEVIRRKIERTKMQAAMDAEIVAIQKRHAPALANAVADIALVEAAILDYCEANRAVLFSEKKSRETAAGVFGFEFTPYRVEPANKKIKWADVVARLLRLDWGKAYVRQAEPKPDKEALLSDREQLTPEHLLAAGIQIVRDEQFFIRPAAETAAETKLAPEH